MTHQKSHLGTQGRFMRWLNRSFTPCLPATRLKFRTAPKCAGWRAVSVIIPCLLFSACGTAITGNEPVGQDATSIPPDVPSYEDVEQGRTETRTWKNCLQSNVKWTGEIGRTVDWSGDRGDFSGSVVEGVPVGAWSFFWEWSSEHGKYYNACSFEFRCEQGMPAGPIFIRDSKEPVASLIDGRLVMGTGKEDYQFPIIQGLREFAENYRSTIEKAYTAEIDRQKREQDEKSAAAKQVAWHENAVKTGLVGANTTYFVFVPFPYPSGNTTNPGDASGIYTFIDSACRVAKQKGHKILIVTSLSGDRNYPPGKSGFAGYDAQMLALPNRYANYMKSGTVKIIDSYEGLTYTPYGLLCQGSQVLRDGNIMEWAKDPEPILKAFSSSGQ